MTTFGDTVFETPTLLGEMPTLLGSVPTLLGHILGDDTGVNPTLWTPSPFVRGIYGILSLAGASLGAYHGYKRNDESVGWAIGWALLGGAFPYVTLPVSYAQGFGKRKK